MSGIERAICLQVAPKGVWITPRLIHTVLEEWAGLPRPVDAIIAAMEYGPTIHGYADERLNEFPASAIRELKNAFKSPDLAAAWPHFVEADAIALDNRVACYVAGLAFHGCLLTAETRQAIETRKLWMRVESLRAALREGAPPAPRPTLEPIDEGDGTIDMTRLTWHDVPPPTPPPPSDGPTEADDADDEAA